MEAGKLLTTFMFIIVAIAAILVYISISWQTFPKECKTNITSTASSILGNLKTCVDNCWRKHDFGKDVYSDDCYVVLINSTTPLTKERIERLLKKPTNTKVYFESLNQSTEYEIKVRYNSSGKEISLIFFESAPVSPSPSCLKPTTQTTDTDFNTGTKNNVIVNDTGISADIILDKDKKNPYIFIGYNFNNTGVKFAKSTDGGENWTTATVDTEGMDRFVSIYALDIKNIFLLYNVFRASVGGNSPKFAKSIDGGDTWTTKVIDTKGGWTESIAASDPKNIFIIFNSGYDILKFAKSTDGGETWTVKEMGKNEIGNENFGHCLPESMAVIDDKTIYIAVDQHGINRLVFSKSIDGGNTWSPKIVTQNIHHCVSIHALDANNIFISYQDNSDMSVNFAKSTDGGNTWSTKKVADAFCNYMRTDIHAIDTNTIFINYYNEKDGMFFAKSVDSGDTWSVKQIDSGFAPLNYALDANRIFAVYGSNDGENIRFAKSTDGGSTWSTKTIDNSPIADIIAFDIYYPSGNFISSEIDMGNSTRFTTVNFAVDTPTDTDIKFQLRSASTKEALSTATWYGPTSTYDFYTTSGTKINLIHNGDRWIQYKAFFSTNNPSYTPKLHDIIVNCA